MTTLGRYELARPLGDGELTWEAELVGPAGFRKRVAVRLLDGADDAALARVRDQGALHHANLVEIYEVDEVDGRWYCAMELVRGGPLAALAPLPPRALVDVGLQIGAAVVARRTAGSGGAVALDRLLIEEGVVKLAVDFGSAGATPEGWVADAVGVAALLAQLGGDVEGTGHPALDALLDAARDGELASVEALSAALDALDVSGPGLAELVADGSTGAAEPWRSTTRTNLDEVAPGVGRVAALREIAGRLATSRLVTVKGPPGVGKSHALRSAARARLDGGAAEVWWVSPGDRYLAHAVRDALGLGPGEDLAAALADRGDVLLLVDPMDAHLAEASELVAWLGAAPSLRIAVTAREPLRVPGEQLVEVGPLDPVDAAALFERHAGVAPDPASLEGAGGLPAVLVAMGEAVADGGPPLDPSVALAGELAEIGRGLAAWERVALAQLSALDGAFTLEQAEAAIDLDRFRDAPWALDVVASLVDRSLLCGRPGVDPPRFHVPAPIRAWARSTTTDRAS